MRSVFTGLNFMMIFFHVYLTDPTTWSEEQVNCWINWAVKEFNLSVDLQKLSGYTGQMLCSSFFDFRSVAFNEEHGIRLNEFFERIKAVSPHRKYLKATVISGYLI